MENVVLVIHLLLALSLIAVVLMQRSEGGGLLGGGGAATSGRPAATALGKVTWALAIAFIITSLTLTVFAAQNSGGSSLIDRLGVSPPSTSQSDPSLAPPSGDLAPPAPGDSGPLIPQLE